MKKDIHPKYFENAKVICACGNTFTVGSTLETIQVELCYNCHPYFTGKEKMLDTAGRVEKFKELQQKTAAASASRKGKKVKHTVRASKKKA